MPATDSELASMEDPHALEDEKGSLTDIPSSAPPDTVPSPAPLVPTTTRPNFTSEAVIETKAVSMASNDCSSALSSPAEASPAKATVTSPFSFHWTIETSPPTSHIASAADSLSSTGTSFVNISESPSSLPVLPSTTFGNTDPKTDFPAVLTFKGVSITLENNSVWKQFNSCGTEMILTKQGRRMFPYCRYRIAGLDPHRKYSLVLSIVPSDQYRYRWNSSKWEVNGPAEHQAQGLIRAFSHHYSPCLGSDWMGTLVSFYKLKLTNSYIDQEGHIILHSMHRYIPRLHVIPVPEGDVFTPEKPVVMGPESMTFTFPQTEFMAVTTYQNFRITQLKINHNPFAKGFREDGNNTRLNRVTTEAPLVLRTDPLPSALKPAELSEPKEEEAVDLSIKNHTVSASLSNEQNTRLVLKPIMSNSGSKHETYVPCIRGKHALGELVLVQKRPCVEPSEETHDGCVNHTQNFRGTPKATSVTPTSTRSSPESSPEYRKRRKRTNRRWGNSRGKEWKAAAASPTVVHSPSLTVAMQPELDDVEGLLFVSFTSKEALEVHARDKPANSTSSASPVSLTTPMQKQTVEVIPEANEDKIIRLEANLLQDLRLLKHRQVIHPVLQEVGMKLSSLDPTKSIDLQYLGVRLPLPPPSLQEEANAASPADEGLPFISRTGKTNDMTKIKGWKNKFIRSKETSPSNSDGSQKNLSAFCSNMLDEYLESEAQYISERAAAFSTNPEGSVAYQLPAKSSSYVKTLDSVLKQRNAASKLSAGANRPCPLSHKPLLYSALTLPAPPLGSPATPIQTGAQSMRQPGAALIADAAAGSDSISSVSQRLPSGFSPRNIGQSHGAIHRSPGFTKFHSRLMLMENGAVNQGLSRTQLTPDRLSVALSVILTKQMQPNQVLKTSKYPKYKDAGPECGQDFCRLGCVCSSLRHLNRGPFHCRRPECMFGCTCFKRKIFKHLTSVESEQQTPPVYSMTNMEHVAQPHPGSHANKLWNRNIRDVDPDPLFTPKSAPLSLFPLKAVKRGSVPRPAEPIREEDKDPVYRYLESMMTCARVREFNSKPPPEVTIEPKILNTLAAKPQETTTDNPPKKYYKSVVIVKPSENGIPYNEMEARKQIEIQSECQWDEDHKMVVEGLYQRVNQNRLSQRFCIGPYLICPVAKIFMQKPSGSIVTYRVQISKPPKSSDNDEDEFDESDEEMHANKSHDEDTDTEECSQIEGPTLRIGVTPFLTRVTPAGILRARTKPVGCQASGLIQVNGKSYNQARLMLGNMGSLHPANRLAAYVTGRLLAPAGIFLKNPEKSHTTNKINPPRTLHIKAAGTVVPPIITARKTTELKTSTQPPVQVCQPDSSRKGSVKLPQNSQNLSTIGPVQMFLSGQRSSASPFQSCSMSSPVSLTVSPSLKTPSFLHQSGTYSFRICPPANQDTRDQKLPGVTLPGGFTLIQLPKPGANGAAQQSESVKTSNVAGMDKAPPLKDALFNFGLLAADSDAKRLGLDTFTRVKELLSSGLVESGSSPGLMCQEKMPSDESDETNSRQVVLDITSEELSSSSSEYSGEGDDDEEDVDIETVEEIGQGMAIAKMKEDCMKKLQKSRNSSDNFISSREFNIKGQMDDGHNESKDTKKRTNHTVLERQRRSEQRLLFDKLQTVLKSDPRAPRLRLLSLALKEIQNLVETSKRLEEKKRRLTRIQSVYMKELSLLSGKSDTVIKDKLKQICEKQKMREKTIKCRPFFSQLLQSRAALLQTTNPPSKLQRSPLLQPNFCATPSQASPDTKHTTAAQKSVDQTPIDRTPITTPPSLPQAVSSPAQVEVTAPSSLAEKKPPTVPSDADTLQVTTAQDGASPPPVFSTPNSNNTKNPNKKSRPFTLPLIRSKTGRLILPSSLKPLGQGFYTLMVMDEPKGEDGEVNTQPSVMDLSKKSASKSDHTADSERSHILKQDRPLSNPKPNPSGAPLAALFLLNKSIGGPSVAVEAVKSQEGHAAVGLNKMPASACLSLHWSPASAEPEPSQSPPMGRRARGRPRRNGATPENEDVKPTVVEDTKKTVSESETSVEKRQRKTYSKSEVTRDSPGVLSDHPVPAKRGRGRPPKSRRVQLRSPPGMRVRSSPSKSSEDSPVRRSHCFKNPDIKPKKSPKTTASPLTTSRPLTRGALGKDFPSAKKRSWIDIEKELEPELESE